MAEENQVFRGDRGPEVSKLDTEAATHRAAPAVKAATAASFNDDPGPETSSAAEPATAPATAPAPASASTTESTTASATASAAAPESPAPELKFEVDASQLWRAPEALAQRIANLQSSSAATSHLLDEQEAETQRIAQQLKSL